MESQNSNINTIPVLATSAEDLSKLLIASIELEETRKEVKQLRMAIKLTDFSVEQLAYLEQLVRNDFSIATSQIVELETRFMDAVSLSQNATYQNWKKEQDLASQWLTQIHTAREIVQSRETANAN